MKALKIKPSLLAAIIFGLFVIVSMSFQGCAGVQVNRVDDPAVRDALLKETGYTIAYYALSREKDETVNRVEKSVIAASAMLSTAHVSEVAKLVIAYVQDFPQWKTGVDNYDVLILRAVNVLTILIDVDLTVPEKYAAAKRGVGAFLAGAGEGIEALRKSRLESKAA